MRDGRGRCKFKAARLYVEVMRGRGRWEKRKG
jgi:hypothetical protein